jgi:hypothetical protein
VVWLGEVLSFLIDVREMFCQTLASRVLCARDHRMKVSLKLKPTIFIGCSLVINVVSKLCEGIKNVVIGHN